MGPLGPGERAGGHEWARFLVGGPTNEEAALVGGNLEVGPVEGDGGQRHRGVAPAGQDLTGVVAMGSHKRGGHMGRDGEDHRVGAIRPGRSGGHPARDLSIRSVTVRCTVQPGDWRSGAEAIPEDGHQGVDDSFHPGRR